jgi:hypothetical protein
VKATSDECLHVRRLQLTCLLGDFNLLDVVLVHDLLETELDLLVPVLVVSSLNHIYYLDD